MGCDDVMVGDVVIFVVMKLWWGYDVDVFISNVRMWISVDDVER
jgi:hypothetical protein